MAKRKLIPLQPTAGSTENTLVESGEQEEVMISIFNVFNDTNMNATVEILLTAIDESITVTWDKKRLSPGEQIKKSHIIPESNLTLNPQKRLGLKVDVDGLEGIIGFERKDISSPTSTSPPDDSEEKDGYGDTDGLL